MNVRELLVNTTTKPKHRQKEIAKEQEEQIEETAEGPSREGNVGSAPVDEQQVKFEIGCSRKCGDALWHEGFRFSFNKKTKTSVYWRCESRTNGCPVTAITVLNDYGTGRIGPEQINIRICQDREDLWLSIDWPTSTSQRAANRRRPFGRALSGNKVANIVVPPEFCLKDVRSFVVYDSSSLNSGSEDRIILFASYKALSFLRETRIGPQIRHFLCARVLQEKATNVRLSDRSAQMGHKKDAGSQRSVEQKVAQASSGVHRDGPAAASLGQFCGQ